MILDPVKHELRLLAASNLPENMTAQVRIAEGEASPGAPARPARAPERRRAELPRVKYVTAAGQRLRAMMAAPLAAGRPAHRRHPGVPPRHPPVHGGRGRPAAGPGRPGGHRHRPRPALRGAGGDGGRPHARARPPEAVRGGRAGDAAAGRLVLDPALAHRAANREGSRTLGCDPRHREPFARSSRRSARARSRRSCATRWPPTTCALRAGDGGAGEIKRFRLTTAPLPGGDDRRRPFVLLVEDITLAKQLERQMLLTERLTTAGAWLAGVAHELNNSAGHDPAGCAESARSRAQGGGAGRPRRAGGLSELPRLIEEEAYRCKEINLQPPAVRARAGRAGGTATDVNTVVLKTVRAAGPTSRATPRAASPPSWTRAARDHRQRGSSLRQVFLGVGSNALDAMDGRPPDHPTRRTRGEVEIEFEDEGPGKKIPDEVAARIWSFLHHQAPRAGHGPGAAIAQGIVAITEGASRCNARRQGEHLPRGACRHERRSACSWPTTRTTCATSSCAS